MKNEWLWKEMEMERLGQVAKVLRHGQKGLARNPQKPHHRRMEGQGEKALVVYVEDCAKDAELFSRAMLQMLPGCAMLHFKDGDLAKSHLAGADQKARPAAIVVDINLPGMKGDELISWIRTQNRFDAVPVIALSSGPAFKTVQDAQAIGATSFFLKPIAYNDWIDLVYAVQDYCA